MTTVTTHTGDGDAALQDALRAFEHAHRWRSVARLRSSFHDEALMESVSSDGLALTADETVEAIRVALADGAYDLGDWQYDYLSPTTVLAITSVRYRVSGAHVRHETVYRLISAKDGLIWRGKLFRSHSEAVAYFETYGPDLGMPPHSAA
jgi:hypothetical protein